VSQSIASLPEKQAIVAALKSNLELIESKASELEKGVCHLRKLKSQLQENIASKQRQLTFFAVDSQ
jgi:hypothetical protein